MTVDRINPETPPRPVMDLYSQVAVGSPGARLVTIAGQLALDPDGELVGAGDYAAQAKQAFRNLQEALEAAGCTPAGLVKCTIHVVDSSPDVIDGLPEWLIEVDAVAVAS